MDHIAPFRILSTAEFLALPRTDKLRYIERAIEVHKLLSAQIASSAHGFAVIRFEQESKTEEMRHATK